MMFLKLDICQQSLLTLPKQKFLKFYFILKLLLSKGLSIYIPHLFSVCVWFSWSRKYSFTELWFMSIQLDVLAKNFPFFAKGTSWGVLFDLAPNSLLILWTCRVLSLSSLIKIPHTPYQAGSLEIKRLPGGVLTKACQVGYPDFTAHPFSLTTPFYSTNSLCPLDLHLMILQSVQT